MKLPVLAFAALSLVACEDSGPVPFGDYGLSGGSSGSAGSSGYGGSAGSGYGGSGGYSGSGGCKGGSGTTCTAHSDCCQVHVNGDLCVGEPVYQCAAKCTASDQCAGNCCVQLAGLSYGACVSGSGFTCLP